MFRRDYIVRMIEDMTAMVAKVFTLKQERKTTEALWEVDELLNRHFRLNSRLMNSLALDDLINMFRLGGVLETDKLQGVARLLKEEASIYAAAGKSEEALQRNLRSLHLFLYADRGGADRSLLGLTAEVDGLLAETERYRLPVATEHLLWPYLESLGRYAKAEDSLYRLWEQGEDVGAEGSAWYERLLLLPQEKLEQGGLPLDEVRQGREEWARLTAKSVRP